MHGVIEMKVGVYISEPYIICYSLFTIVSNRDIFKANRPFLFLNRCLMSYETEFIQKLLHERNKNILLWPSIRQYTVNS
jgi:hypothetical protein